MYTVHCIVLFYTIHRTIPGDQSATARIAQIAIIENAVGMCWFYFLTAFRVKAAIADCLLVLVAIRDVNCLTGIGLYFR